MARTGDVERYIINPQEVWPYEDIPFALDGFPHKLPAYGVSGNRCILSWAG
jgi:FAD/FMN-containing dehydrogenase